MGGSPSKPYTFATELKLLCSEHEEIGDKQMPVIYPKNRVRKTGNPLGKGTLGPITKCTLQLEAKRRASLPVVVVSKAVRKRGAGPRTEVLQGVAQMAQLGEHATAHVVRLIGVVTSPMSKLQVLLEYCESGSLDIYMSQRTGISKTEKFQILADVSDGMSELEACGAVHGNLSLRNILVTSGGQVCKVSDWGRRCTDVRRLAPELIDKAHADRIFTHATDVWMFGLLSYEIFQHGEPAFSPRWDDLHVISKVTSGFQPPLKEDGECPQDLYDVLCTCWKLDPAGRPDFFWLRGDMEDKVAIAKAAEEAKARQH